MRRPGRWWAWRGVQVVAVALGVGVVGLVLSPAHAAHAVTYRLDWDLDGVTRHADGSWTVTTDDGAEVTVTGGRLATWSTTLVECEHGHGPFDRLATVLGVATAAAGHGTGSDPAEARDPVVQPLVDPEATELGTATLVEPGYCRAHLAVAGSGASEDEVTLVVRGRWREPGAASATPFVLRTTQAWGTLVDVEVDTDAGEVTFVRSLATAFDEVDPATQTAEEQARSVLAALTEDLTVEA